jgi:hypothetical protein
MPEARLGIKFTNDGICSVCVAFEKKKTINLDTSFRGLEQLCDKYRNGNGKNRYDCMIAVSGGNDNHFSCSHFERSCEYESYISVCRG